MDKILEVKNLRKVFRNDIFKKPQLAIDDLSCYLRAGDCTGLLGHNGAGKTTMIRILFGLIKPDRGEVLFKGAPIDTRAKTSLGYMPEVSKLPETLNPQEILRYHLMSFGKPADKELIESKLSQVGLWDARKKMVRNLSKGMARRLGWAQATIHEPELIILDEPFSGLDPAARQDLMHWILEYKAKKKSLLLCTHELWTVQSLCDELHVFKKGRLAYSTIDESFKDAENIMHTYYKIHITGSSEDELVQLRDRYNLQSWKSIHQEGHLCRLYFNEYGAANEWLRATTTQGMIVVKFSDDLSVEDRQIRSLFKGD